MLKAAGHEAKVAKLKIKERDLEPYKGVYEQVMTNLKKLYSREKHDSAT